MPIPPIHSQHAVTPARLTPEEWDAVLAEKGWTKKDLARRWNKSPVWISNIARNADRAPHWDDALLGLPNRRFLARNERRRRKQIEAILARARGLRPATGGYRYHGYLTIGAIVTADKDVGSVAEEGMRGIVVKIRDTGRQEEYCVVFESGEFDWFPPDYVDSLLVFSGLVDDETANAGVVPESTILERFARGLFRFW